MPMHVVVMAVVAMIAVALIKPQWRRSYRGWSNIVGFGASSLLIWMLISDAYAIREVNAYVKAYPDSSLRFVQLVVSDAAREQDASRLSILVLLLAASFLWALGRVRSSPNNPGNAA